VFQSLAGMTDHGTLLARIAVTGAATTLAA
jgi:hypothetical protein